MRIFGAYRDKMSRLRMSDREIELLLSGDQTVSDEFSQLEGFVAALARQSTPPQGAAHMGTALAATARSAAPGPVRRRFSRLVVLGATTALLLGFSGLALAADRAAPGDILYGLDRALEKIGIGAGGIDERLAEFETLLRRGDEAAALSFYEEEIRDAATNDEGTTADDSSPDGDDPGDDDSLGVDAGKGDSAGVGSPFPGSADNPSDAPRNGGDTGQGSTSGNGQANTPPGQETTPPGQEQTPPGQEQTPPGQEQTPPGQEKTPPGQEQTPPGQEKTPPGQEQTPPGQEKTPPGQERTPPGQGGTPPGQG